MTYHYMHDILHAEEESRHRYYVHVIEEARQALYCQQLQVLSTSHHTKGLHAIHERVHKYGTIANEVQPPLHGIRN